MTQPDVALTDYLLTAECSIFVWILARHHRNGAKSLSGWFMAFFAALAVAAALGGTVHGFYEDPSSMGSRILWPSTLIAIGIAALAGTEIVAILRFTTQSASILSWIAIMIFGVYLGLVVFVTSNFVVAILDYFPVLLLLAWAFFETYRQTGQNAFRNGLVGIFVMLGGTALQQTQMGVPRRYFNHNAIYHLLQAVGLFLIFLTARHAIENKTEAKEWQRDVSS
jgi:hypothetical protein